MGVAVKSSTRNPCDGTVLYLDSSGDYMNLHRHI